MHYIISDQSRPISVSFEVTQWLLQRAEIPRSLLLYLEGEQKGRGCLFSLV